MFAEANKKILRDLLHINITNTCKYGENARIEIEFIMAAMANILPIDSIARPQALPTKGRSWVEQGAE